MMISQTFADPDLSNFVGEIPQLSKLQKACVNNRKTNISHLDSGIAILNFCLLFYQI